MMSAYDVGEVIDALKEAGIPVWLDGGWGVDALVGRQTRSHDDLDVVIAGEHAQAAQDVLTDLEFRVTVNELPTRFVMDDARGRSIDFHTVTFDPEGGGIQELQNGSAFRYPPEGFTGQGMVDGHPVRALTPEVQALCHLGYDPDEKDHHDMALLSIAGLICRGHTAGGNGTLVLRGRERRVATTQVLLWLQEDTAAALRARAAMRGGKGALSTVADDLLRSGLGLMSERDADTTALPAIEAVVRRVVAEQAQADAERARADTERLASLIVKAIREASVGRWLTLGLIERVRGRSIADEERERAFTAAAGVLRGRLDSEDATTGERRAEG